ncbi:glycosyltransferase BC10-like [Oryza brachyantha]|uniref:glycosyltransferase BC10-like n=1 Tax=Oryza brachyantha TaxID=4533 RepID=UPI001ADBAC57|nr:glycosyltransferase BC10-like [Oryza brachyantha]
MNSTNKPMAASHSGSKLLKAVLFLLIFSLGFIMGMVSMANFPKFYDSPLLSPMLFSSLAPSSTPTAPAPSPETPCAWPPSSPSPPPPSAPPPPVERPAAPAGLAAFLAPSGVVHAMTDEELLWRASMAPKVSRTPYSRVPKVAFMFLVTNRLPLRPLWEKFFAGHNRSLYSIYVHSHPPFAASLPTDSVFYGRMIPSQRTSWGDANLVEAERRLLANALLDLSNERFALLSESCIPIFDFPAVYAHLTGSNDSFVDCFDNAGARARYKPDVFGRHNITQAHWRKGSQWFEMDRALAVEVVADGSYFPAFRACTRCIIDEHYIPTLVNILGWRRNTNRTLTYMEWRRGTSHPRTHEAGDVTEELLRKMRTGAANCTYNGAATNMCFVFARKFSPDALAPLLELAPKVMGFG